jgi:hypothetical protein
MAPKVAKNSLFQSPKFLACCLSLVGTFTFTQIAVGAPPNGLGGTREFSQTEAADPAPGPVSVARIQSAAKKDVDEAVLQEKVSGPTTPPPPVPKNRRAGEESETPDRFIIGKKRHASSSGRRCRYPGRR